MATFQNQHRHRVEQPLSLGIVIRNAFKTQRTHYTAKVSACWNQTGGGGVRKIIEKLLRLPNGKRQRPSRGYYYTKDKYDRGYTRLERRDEGGCFHVHTTYLVSAGELRVRREAITRHGLVAQLRWGGGRRLRRTGNGDLHESPSLRRQICTELCAKLIRGWLGSFGRDRRCSPIESR